MDGLVGLAGLGARLQLAFMGVLALAWRALLDLPLPAALLEECSRA
jgi:hypothetical protein